MKKTFLTIFIIFTVMGMFLASVSAYDYSAVENALTEFENKHGLLDSDVQNDDAAVALRFDAEDRELLESWEEDVEEFDESEGFAEVIEPEKDLINEDWSEPETVLPKSKVLSEKGSEKSLIEDISNDVVIDVLSLKDMDIMDVLKLISQKSQVNIIAGTGVGGKVTIYLQDVKMKDALRIILDSNNLAYKVEDKIIRVMPAKEFETRYGYPFGGQIQTQIIHLLYAEATDAVTVLNQMKSPKGKIIFNLKSNTLVLMDTPEKIDMMQNLIAEIDVPVKTEVFELSYTTPSDISEKIREHLTNNVGDIKADDRSGKLIVTDTAIKLKEIDKIIQAFDIKDQQVLIEAKILQIILRDQFKWGVDWQGIVRDYHDLDITSDFDLLGSSDKSGTLSIGTIDRDDYTALVQALETVGTTNILSNPSITVINNQEAKILVGSTEPYVTSTTTTPASGPTTTAESINFIEVGVKLFVTPTIHSDGFVTMKIKPEVSSVTSTVTTSNNNTIPVVDTSEAETTVMVKDGVTIVIGGLIKDEKIETENKVPLLGDLPLVRNAFRNVDDLVRKTEIVIFLTPNLITGDVPSREDLDAFLN